MIGPLIVVALLGAPGADIRWADVPLEAVPDAAPVVTRIFAVPHGRLEDLAEIASLFEERLRIVATGDRLVVVGPESLLDHIARVAEVAFGSTGEDWQGEPADGEKLADAPVETVSSPPLDAARAGTFPRAIADAVSDAEITFSDFPRPSSRRLATGEEIRQKLVLTPAPLERLVGFARKVLEQKDVRLASFEARKQSQRREADDVPYVATFEFVLLPTEAAETAPFLDFGAAYDDLTRRLESSGVSADLRSMALNLEGRRVAAIPLRVSDSIRRRSSRDSSTRVRFHPSTVLLISPDAQAHLALTDAFRADDSLFSATASARPQSGAYRVDLRLEPSVARAER